MRLDKFLCAAKNISRSQARELIRGGAVTRGGEVEKDPGTLIEAEDETVALRGEVLRFCDGRYLLMHKPLGVLSASRDEAQKTVLDLIAPKDRARGLSPAGRLDKDTSGLLLLTDNGQFVHRLISPKFGVPRYYLALLRDPCGRDDRERFRKGVRLLEKGEEITCAPAEYEAVGNRVALVGVREGRYHEVRRMFAALGNFVQKLARIQVGNLHLPPDLAPGCYLEIMHKDALKALENSCISRVNTEIVEKISSEWIKESEKLW